MVWPITRCRRLWGTKIQPTWVRESICKHKTAQPTRQGVRGSEISCLWTPAGWRWAQQVVLIALMASLYLKELVRAPQRVPTVSQNISYNQLSTSFPSKSLLLSTLGRWWRSNVVANGQQTASYASLKDLCPSTFCHRLHVNRWSKGRWRKNHQYGSSCEWRHSFALKE